MGLVSEEILRAPEEPRLVQEPTPWSHSKYISPDSAQPPLPEVVIAPPIKKLPLGSSSGSTVGRGIVTPVILVDTSYLGHDTAPTV